VKAVGTPTLCARCTDDGCLDDGGANIALNLSAVSLLRWAGGSKVTAGR